MLFRRKAKELPDRGSAIADREQAVQFNPKHFVNGNPIVDPVPTHLRKAVFGMGCFWGAERLFWEISGVYSTAVGYAGGITANPSYEDVCSGMTGHTEAVLVYYDPDAVDYDELLGAFWEAHDPTQGMRQGNDRGTQYRSAIYATTATQVEQAQASKSHFQAALTRIGKGQITTEIKTLDNFYYAEDYHQQYLAKNPGGYCGLAGTGASYAPASESATS